jgi:hypothetical protein
VPVTPSRRFRGCLRRTHLGISIPHLGLSGPGLTIDN